MSKRKQELISYIDMLRKLNSDGYTVRKEMIQAFNELNLLMFAQPTDFIVIENDLNGVLDSLELFQDILGEQTRMTRTNDDLELEFGHKKVRIYTISKGLQKFRGLRTNRIINNTDNKEVEELIEVEALS